jgi:hypothetical protein
MTLIRRAGGRAAKSAALWTSLHARNEGIFYRGVGPNSMGKGHDLQALGAGLYVTWNAMQAEAFAGPGGTVLRYRLPLNLVMMDDRGRDMAEIKASMGFQPWEYAAGPMFAAMLRMSARDRGYDGVVSDNPAMGIVVFDEGRVEALD